MNEVGGQTRHCGGVKTSTVKPLGGGEGIGSHEDETSIVISGMNGSIAMRGGRGGQSNTNSYLPKGGGTSLEALGWGDTEHGEAQNASYGRQSDCNLEYLQTMVPYVDDEGPYCSYAGGRTVFTVPLGQPGVEGLEKQKHTTTEERTLHGQRMKQTERKDRSQIQREYRQRQRAKICQKKHEVQGRLGELETIKAENERLKKELDKLEARMSNAAEEYGMHGCQAQMPRDSMQEIDIIPAAVSPISVRILQGVQQLIDSAVEYATQPTERALEWILRHLTRTFGFQFLQLIVPLIQRKMRHVLDEYEAYPERRDECVRKLDSIGETRRRILQHQYSSDPDFALRVLLYGWVGDSYSEGVCMPGVPRIPEAQVMALARQMKLSDAQLRRYKKAWCSFVAEWNGTRDNLYDSVVSLENKVEMPYTSDDMLESSLSLHQSAKTILSLQADVKNLEEINAVQRDAAFQLFYSIVRDTIDPVQAAYAMCFCPRFLPNIMYLAKALAFSDINPLRGRMESNVSTTVAEYEHTS